MNVFETGPDKTQQWQEKTPHMHVLSLLLHSKILSLKYRQLEVSPDGRLVVETFLYMNFMSCSSSVSLDM